MRIASIDIFRGLVILSMIFFNLLAGAVNVPAWMLHAPAELNHMTVVDIIFPAFLFAVGLSIPLALERRKSAGEPAAVTWKHIIQRSLTLVLMGLFSVYAEAHNESDGLWIALGTISFILIWAQFPAPARTRSFLKFSGIGLLLTLLVWHVLDNGTVSLWPGWPGILGIIGWCYLYACAIYYLSATRLPVLMAGLMFFLALYPLIAFSRKAFPDISFDYITSTFIILCGTITSILLFAGPYSSRPSSQRFIRLSIFLALLFVAGNVFYPWLGISKDLSTPSYVLLTSAWCLLAFLLVYWLADVRGEGRWFSLLVPAGKNALLAYILSEGLARIIPVPWLDSPHALIAVLGTAGYAAAMLILIAWLTRWNIRMPL